jgi:UDP-glucose 4-epimerase
MPNALITGGAGFFGGIVKQRLLQNGFQVTSIDRVRDPGWHPRLRKVYGDIRNRNLIEYVFRGDAFDAVFHCAAVFAKGFHADKQDLWSTNVEATRLLGEAARRYRVPKFIFLSTHCLWAANLGRPVAENEPLQPQELYGQSKAAAEAVLRQFADQVDITVLRSPTIIDRGRLGLLAILFEFIREHKTVWVVGDGGNRHQFIHAEDLANACMLALRAQGSDTYHVGSDNVPSQRQVYEAVIREAGSRSRIRSLPRHTTLGLMRLADRLRLSPLEPHHYRMIAEDFLFDTRHIKEKLGWRPTLTNEQMLIRAYRYYSRRSEEIQGRGHASAHAQPAARGVMRLLKWVS